MSVTPGELYTPLKPDRQETRFFTFFPAGDKQDPVQGTIEVGSLEAPPQYEAISWYWGDATITERIMVNGTEFHVPRNMYEALIHMRLPDRPPCLWTDAVCINQPHLKERASQIAMMGDIYRYSRCTLVWLGPFTEW